MKMHVQITAHISIPVGQKVEAYCAKTGEKASAVVEMALKKFFGMPMPGQEKAQQKKI